MSNKRIINPYLNQDELGIQGPREKFSDQKGTIDIDDLSAYTAELHKNVIYNLSDKEEWKKRKDQFYERIEIDNKMRENLRIKNEASNFTPKTSLQLQTLQHQDALDEEDKREKNEEISEAEPTEVEGELSEIMKKEQEEAQKEKDKYAKGEKEFSPEELLAKETAEETSRRDRYIQNLKAVEYYETKTLSGFIDYYKSKKPYHDSVKDTDNIVVKRWKQVGDAMLNLRESAGTWLAGTVDFTEQYVKDLLKSDYFFGDSNHDFRTLTAEEKKDYTRRMTEIGEMEAPFKRERMEARSAQLKEFAETYGLSKKEYRDEVKDNVVNAMGGVGVYKLIRGIEDHEVKFNDKSQYTRAERKDILRTYDMIRSGERLWRLSLESAEREGGFNRTKDFFSGMTINANNAITLGLKDMGRDVETARLAYLGGKEGGRELTELEQNRIKAYIDLQEDFGEAIDPDSWLMTGFATQQTAAFVFEIMAGTALKAPIAQVTRGGLNKAISATTKKEALKRSTKALTKIRDRVTPLAVAPTIENKAGKDFLGKMLEAAGTSLFMASTYKTAADSYLGDNVQTLTMGDETQLILKDVERVNAFKVGNNYMKIIDEKISRFDEKIAKGEMSLEDWAEFDNLQDDKDFLDSQLSSMLDEGGNIKTNSSWYKAVMEGYRNNMSELIVERYVGPWVDSKFLPAIGSRLGKTRLGKYYSKRKEALNKKRRGSDKGLLIQSMWHAVRPGDLIQSPLGEFVEEGVQQMIPSFYGGYEDQLSELFSGTFYRNVAIGSLFLSGGRSVRQGVGAFMRARGTSKVKRKDKEGNLLPSERESYYDYLRSRSVMDSYMYSLENITDPDLAQDIVLGTYGTYVHTSDVMGRVAELRNRNYEPNDGTTYKERVENADKIERTSFINMARKAVEVGKIKELKEVINSVITDPGSSQETKKNASKAFDVLLKYEAIVERNRGKFNGGHLTKMELDLDLAERGYNEYIDKLEDSGKLEEAWESIQEMFKDTGVEADLGDISNYKEYVRAFSKELRVDEEGERTITPRGSVLLAPIFQTNSEFFDSETHQGFLMMEEVLKTIERLRGQIEYHKDPANEADIKEAIKNYSEAQAILLADMENGEKIKKAFKDAYGDYVSPLTAAEINLRAKDNTQAKAFKKKGLDTTALLAPLDGALDSAIAYAQDLKNRKNLKILDPREEAPVLEEKELEVAEDTSQFQTGSSGGLGIDPTKKKRVKGKKVSPFRKSPAEVQSESQHVAEQQDLFDGLYSKMPEGIDPNNLSEEDIKKERAIINALKKGIEQYLEGQESHGFDAMLALIIHEKGRVNAIDSFDLLVKAWNEHFHNVPERKVTATESISLFNTSFGKKSSLKGFGNIFGPTAEGKPQISSIPEEAQEVIDKRKEKEERDRKRLEGPKPGEVDTEGLVYDPDLGKYVPYQLSPHTNRLYADIGLKADTQLGINYVEGEGHNEKIDTSNEINEQAKPFLNWENFKDGVMEMTFHIDALLDLGGETSIWENTDGKNLFKGDTKPTRRIVTVREKLLDVFKDDPNFMEDGKVSIDLIVAALREYQNSRDASSPLFQNSKFLEIVPVGTIIDGETHIGGLPTNDWFNNSTVALKSYQNSKGEEVQMEGERANRIRDNKRINLNARKKILENGTHKFEIESRKPVATNTLLSEQNRDAGLTDPNAPREFNSVADQFGNDADNFNKNAAITFFRGNTIYQDSKSGDPIMIDGVEIVFNNSTDPSKEINVVNAQEILNQKNKEGGIKDGTTILIYKEGYKNVNGKLVPQYVAREVISNHSSKTTGIQGHQKSDFKRQSDIAKSMYYDILKKAELDQESLKNFLLRQGKYTVEQIEGADLSKKAFLDNFKKVFGYEFSEYSVNMIQRTYPNTEGNTNLKQKYSSKAFSQSDKAYDNVPDLDDFVGLWDFVGALAIEPTRVVPKNKILVVAGNLHTPLVFTEMEASNGTKIFTPNAQEMIMLKSEEATSIAAKSSLEGIHNSTKSRLETNKRKLEEALALPEDQQNRSHIELLRDSIKNLEKSLASAESVLSQFKALEEDSIESNQEDSTEVNEDDVDSIEDETSSEPSFTVGEAQILEDLEVENLILMEEIEYSREETNKNSTPESEQIHQNLVETNKKLIEENKKQIAGIRGEIYTPPKETPVPNKVGKEFTALDMDHAVNVLAGKVISSIDATQEVIDIAEVYNNAITELDAYIKDLEDRGMPEEADFLRINKNKILGLDGQYDGSVREYIDVKLDIGEIDVTISESGQRYGLASYEIDAKEDLSNRIKIVLSHIPDTRTAVGFGKDHKLMSSSDALNALQQAIVASPDGTIEGIIAVMKAKVEINPKDNAFYLNIIEQIEQLKEHSPHLVNEIMFKLYQTEVDMKQVMHRRAQNGTLSLDVIDPNSRNPLFVKRSLWREQMKQSGILEFSEGNFYKLNKEVYAELLSEWNSLRKSYTSTGTIASVNRQRLEKVLDTLGISLNAKTLDNLYDHKRQNNRSVSDMLFDSSHSTIQNIMDNLAIMNDIKAENTKYTFDEVDPGVENAFKFDPLQFKNSRINDLIKADNFVEFIAMTSVYSGGKTVNATEQFNQSSVIFRDITNDIKELIEIKKSKGKMSANELRQHLSGRLKQLSDSPITSESNLLNLILSDPQQMLETLGMFSDSLEFIKQYGDPVREDMGITQIHNTDHFIAALTLFSKSEGVYQDAALTEKYGGQIKFRKGFAAFPTVSDSQHLPFLKSVVVDLTTENYSPISKTFSPQTLRYLTDNLVTGELRRIASYIMNVSSQGKTSNIQYYDQGAVRINSMSSIGEVLVEFIDQNGVPRQRPLNWMFNHTVNSILESDPAIPLSEDTTLDSFIDGERAIKVSDLMAVRDRLRKLTNDTEVAAKLEEVDGLIKNFYEEMSENFLEEYRDVINQEITDNLNFEADKIHDDLNNNELIEVVPANAENSLDPDNQKLVEVVKLKAGTLSDSASKPSRMLAMDMAMNNYIQYNDIQNIFAGDLAFFFKSNTLKGASETGLYKVTFDDIASHYYPGDLKEITSIIDGVDLKDLSEEQIDEITEKFPMLRNADEILDPSIPYETVLESHLPIYRTISNRVYKEVQNNVSKRLKLISSPGNLLPNKGGNRTYLQIMVNDVEVSSSYIEDYITLFHNELLQDPDFMATLESFKELDNDIYARNLNEDAYRELRESLMNKLPGIENYMRINAGDGQEYTTWKEHLDILLDSGKISDLNLFISLKNKLEQQSKDLEEFGEIKKENLLTENEKTIIFQPMKPLGTGQVNQDLHGMNINRTVYVKSSSFPLIPELTQMFSSKLDKRRQAMEKIQRDSGQNVRLGFSSAIKVGGVAHPIDIAMLDKESLDLVDFESVANSTIQMNRDNFFIQQEVPFDPDQEHITRMTQFEKILLGNGINEITDYVFDASLIDPSVLKSAGVKVVDGKINGPALADVYKEIYKQEQNLHTTKLLQDLGIKDFTDIPNKDPVVMENLARRINQRLSKKQDAKSVELVYTAKKRLPNGQTRDVSLSKAELQRSGLTPTKAEFVFPLMMNPNSRKMEAVLNSIINKSHINLKLSGFSFVVGSQEGFDYRNYSKEALTDLRAKGLVVTKDFDMENGLKPDEVFMTNKLKFYNPDTGNYETVEIENYLDEEGYIDFTKMDPELLEFFTARIPTSAHQSGKKVRIAGFLPSNMGDLIIVSRDSTIQLGEDYDIDKRYGYKYHLTKDLSGKLKRVQRSDIGALREYYEMTTETIEEARNIYNNELERITRDYFNSLPENERQYEEYLSANAETIAEIERIEEQIRAQFEFDSEGIPTERLLDLSNNINRLFKSIFRDKYDIQDVTLAALEKVKFDLEAKILPQGLEPHEREQLKWAYHQMKNNITAEKNAKQENLEEEADQNLSTLAEAYSEMLYHHDINITEEKALQNDLISLYTSVFGSQDSRVQKTINSVLNTDFAGDSANLIDEKVNKGEKYFNLHSYHTQRGIMAAGSAGQSAIGKHSNLVTFNSILQQLGDKIRFYSHEHPKTGALVPYNSIFGTLNGKPRYFDGVFGKVLDPAGEQIANYLMQNQNSALDNQTLEIMYKRNENSYTMGVMAIMQMAGLEQDLLNIVDDFGRSRGQFSYSSLFIAQPVLREYSRRLAKHEDSTSGDRSYAKSTTIKELVELFKELIPADNFKTRLNKEGKEEIVVDKSGLPVLKDEVSKEQGLNLSSQVLYNSLLSEENRNLDGTLRQYYVLSKFLELSRIEGQIGELQGFTNIESQGMGLSYFDAIEMKDKFIDYATTGFQDMNMSTVRGMTVHDKNITPFKEMFGEPKFIHETDIEAIQEVEADKDYIYIGDRDGARFYIKPSSHYGHKIAHSISLGYNLWNSLLPYDNDVVKDQIQDISRSLGYDTNFPEGKKLQYDIISGMKDYAYTDILSLFEGNLDKTSSELFFNKKPNPQTGDPGNEALASYLLRVSKMKDSNGDLIYGDLFNLPFFRNIQYEINESSFASVIKFNAGKMSKEDNLALYNSLDRIINSSRPLPERNGKAVTEESLMKDLLKYSLIANQEFGAVGFRDQLPVTLFQKYGVDVVLRTRSDFSRQTTSHLYGNILKSVESRFNTKMSPDGVIHSSQYSYAEVERYVENLNLFALKNYEHEDMFSITEEGNIVYNLHEQDAVNTGTFARQYIQHNANKTKKRILETNKAMQSILRDNGFSWDNFNDNEVKQFNYFNVEDHSPFKFIQVDDGTLQIFELASLDGKTGMGVYNRIPHLGGFGFNEYKAYKRVNSSKIASNNIDYGDIAIPANDVPSVNTLLEEGFLRERTNESLNNPQSKYHALYAVFGPFIPNLDKIEVRVESGLKGAASFSYANTTKTKPVITFNQEMMEGGKLTPENFEDILAEEILHSISREVLDPYIQFTSVDHRGVNVEFKVPDSEVPAEILSLISVYSTAIRHYVNGPDGKKFLAEMARFDQETRRQQEDGESGATLVGTGPISDAAYASQNIHEFLAGIFIKDKPFAQEMAKTPYRKSKETILDKFVGLFHRLVSRLIPGAKKGSISRAAAENFYSLLLREADAQRDNVEYQKRFPDTSRIISDLNEIRALLKKEEISKVPMEGRSVVPLLPNPVDIKARTPEDQAKANRSNKIIAHGVAGTPTARYAHRYGGTATSFQPGDVVMISVNEMGETKDKAEQNTLIGQTKEDIKLAVSQGATHFLASKLEDANSEVNRSGEGVIRKFLMEEMGMSYVEINGIGLYISPKGAVVETSQAEELGVDIRYTHNTELDSTTDSEKKSYKQVRIRNNDGSFSIVYAQKQKIEGFEDVDIRMRRDENGNIRFFSEKSGINLDYEGDTKKVGEAKVKLKESLDSLGKEAIEAMINNAGDIYAVAPKAPVTVSTPMPTRALQAGQNLQGSLFEQAQHLISNTLGSEWKTLPVYSERGVNTMRTENKEVEYAHFGNPFSEGGYSGTKRTKDVSTAIQAYKDWLKDDYIIYEDSHGVVQEIEEGYKKEQRQWILEQINSGKLNNVTLLYSEKLADRGLGSHAEALLEVIQEIRGIGSNIKSNISINKDKWTKDSPKQNPDTAYVFTENINSIGSNRVGGGSAVIRNNPNAIGIVTKKYYVYSEDRATSDIKGGWNQNFKDTEADFELFKKTNLEQFKKLDKFDSIIFPDSFANSLASIPNRFALWLQNELQTRYGLITELNSKGTGLISKSVNQIQSQQQEQSPTQPREETEADKFHKDEQLKMKEAREKIQIFESEEAKDEFLEEIESDIDYPLDFTIITDKDGNRYHALTLISYYQPDKKSSRREEKAEVFLAIPIDERIPYNIKQIMLEEGLERLKKLHPEVDTKRDVYHLDSIQEEAGVEVTAEYIPFNELRGLDKDGFDSEGLNDDNRTREEIAEEERKEARKEEVSNYVWDTSRNSFDTEERDVDNDTLIVDDKSKTRFYVSEGRSHNLQYSPTGNAVLYKDEKGIYRVAIYEENIGHIQVLQEESGISYRSKYFAERRYKKLLKEMEEKNKANEEGEKQDEGLPEVETNYSRMPQTDVKVGIEEVFNENPELANTVYEALGFTGNITPEQKQQAQQAYSQYLDTIFPESKEDRILVHASHATNIEKFEKRPNKNFLGFAQLGKGVYLTDLYNLDYWRHELELGNGEGKNYYVKVNLQNIVGINNFLTREKESTLGDDIDAVYENMQPHQKPKIGEWRPNQYAVRNPEQIHILGSKQDIEGFKDFVKSRMPQTDSKADMSMNKDSKSAFNDIVNGEKTSVLRKPEWYEKRPEEYSRIKDLKKGDKITIWENDSDNARFETITLSQNAEVFGKNNKLTESRIQEIAQTENMSVEDLKSKGFIEDADGVVYLTFAPVSDSHNVGTGTSDSNISNPETDNFNVSLPNINLKCR